MAILSDKEILEALASGAIDISPKPDQLQFDACSLDLFMGEGAKVWKPQPEGAELTLVAGRFDYAKNASQYLQDARREGDRVLIAPGQFMLALTRESVFLKPESKIMAWVEGKSSLARMGLQVHMTAPTIHVGFKGHITLEFLNSGVHTLALEVGKSRVCQLIFDRVGTVAEKQRGTFHDQKSVTG